MEALLLPLGWFTDAENVLQTRINAWGAFELCFYLLHLFVYINVYTGEHPYYFFHSVLFLNIKWRLSELIIRNN